MKRTSAAVATIMALTLWAASTQSLVPVHDHANVTQLIDNVTSSLKQVQGLRQLGQSFADVTDSIGSLGEVANFKNALIDIDFMRDLSIPKWSSIIGGGGDGDREGDREGDSGSTANNPLIVRGGPPDGWDSEEAVDRPTLETAEQANEWTVNELYGVSSAGLHGQNQAEAERVKALRRTMLQGAARNAYTIGAAAPAAMKEYEEEREHLAKQLDAATSLREETAVLGLAIIAALSGRAEQTLIAASALELEAMSLIAESPPMVSQEMKDRLLGTNE